MKIAFVFPGQASQYVGMGMDLYERSKLAREIFDMSEEILGFNLKKICFEGPEDELKQTRITQPAIFVHSFIVSRLIGDILRADMVAGHSLGEYSALVYAGVMSFEDGLKLVKLRGELMQRAGELKPGAMAAIIGLDDKIDEVCDRASDTGIVQPANFNAPGQVVISGEVEAVRKAMRIAKELGAKIVKELVVSGAFHSPLMEYAKDELRKALDEIKLRDAKIPIYANVTGEAVTRAVEIKELLYRQITSPVLWRNIIANMYSDGARMFFEIGPGGVLQGLIKRIISTVEVAGIDKFEDVVRIKNNQ
jgi:[acyl-carrier-protein] S-malonyltransferase